MSTYDKASTLLDQIRGNGPIDMSIALVVAHPDDETIAAAGLMARLRTLTLIHVTDGRAGGTETLGALRMAELEAALVAMAARPVQTFRYGLPDGSVVHHLVDLVHRLAVDLAGCDIVLTHPYEGGHVDHDACAFAVRKACRVIADVGGAAPDRAEFAGYHRRRQAVRASEFWPDALSPPLRVDLAPDAVQRRVSAFACHRSQEGNLRYFSMIREIFRVAPAYDFLSMPPPGSTLYGSAVEALLAERFRALLP